MKKLFSRVMLLMMPLMALSIASCSSNNDEPKQDPDSNVKSSLSFVTNISPMSRATEYGFEVGDEISVFAIDPKVSPSGVLQSTNYGDNIRHRYDGKLFNAVSNPLYYPSQKDNLFFKAIYPYQSALSETFAFDVMSDQRSYTNYTLSDLMMAETASTHEEIPHLIFKHYLCNIIVNLHFEADRPVGEPVVTFANVNTGVKFSINNKSVLSAYSPSTVLGCPNGTDSYKIIAAPTTLYAGTTLLYIQIGNNEYNWDLSQNLDWRSGRQYTYDLTVSKSGEIRFTAEILPWGESGEIQDIIPAPVIPKIEPYIPIYTGVNPPNIEGAYFIDQMETVYCEDYGKGGFEPGRIVASRYIKFYNQNQKTLTLDYESQSTASSQDTGYGAFIRGEGNNFTVYFDTQGNTDGISTRTALVISGTKTSAGIANIRYAFVMAEKGPDPNNTLMEEGVFRVFKDSDELAANSSWGGLGSRSGADTFKLELPSIYSSAR